MMILRISISSLLSFILGAALFAAVRPAAGSVAKAVTVEAQEDRAADAAAIRAHIESIFQAFIDGDVEKIYATHSDDWRGFLEGSRIPIKGIDEYMRANGIEWPRPADAPKTTPYYPAGTRYRVSNFDVHFYSPELAVASFFGDFERNIGGATVTMRRFRIMDVYAKRKGSWIQVASHTVVDPDWRLEQMSKPAIVTPQIREQVMTAREAVWKAYFANDRAALERLIPDDAIAIDNGSSEWSDRAAILAGARRFADGGGKLARLEFPKTEMQIYGAAVIVYTSYICETERNGKRAMQSGRGTEIFVRRGNELVNAGWHLDSGK
jgi:ketosteroid isomerase-like protein